VYSELQLLQSPSLSQAVHPVDLPLVPQHRDPLQEPDEHSDENEQEDPSDFFDGGDGGGGGDGHDGVAPFTWLILYPESEQIEEQPLIDKPCKSS
jgi:hypothetical protein